MSAENTTQSPAWAVYVGERGDSDSECVVLLAESEDEAREMGLRESDDDYDEVKHVDGPFEDSEPGVWSFTFRTEHKEKVIVKAPNEEYAEEMAEHNRDYRGELVQTVHTESRKVMSMGDSDE